ncbi:MAG: DUF1810 family protein [Pseudolabrys sp.]
MCASSCGTRTNRRWKFWECPTIFKFRSCLTLFYEAATDKSDRSLFAETLKQFYKGEPDPRTLELLRSK